MSLVGVAEPRATEPITRNVGGAEARGHLDDLLAPPVHVDEGRRRAGGRYGIPVGRAQHLRQSRESGKLGGGRRHAEHVSRFGIEPASPIRFPTAAPSTG